MTGPVEDLPLDEDRIDGYTVGQLADYLRRGRVPREAGIENSAACRQMLITLQRMQTLYGRAAESEAARNAASDDAWIASLLARVKAEVAGGPDIPVDDDQSTVRLVIAEAAVRGMIRDAGDLVEGVVISRTALVGDRSTATGSVRVEITAAIRYGIPIPSAAGQLRTVVAELLSRHTQLTVTAIDIRIDTVYLHREDHP